MNPSPTLKQKLTLVSHLLCPYVQRAAIVLAEKGIAFERIDIDLANKPDWFLKISPLGKTPVLLVDGQAIFESAVICEYLEETTTSPLHPRNAITRAQHRGWMEFGSTVLNAIAGFYAAPDDKQLAAKSAEIAAKFQQVEDALTTTAKGPYFAGQQFSMVDAVFGPIFRYFDVLETIDDFGFFAHTPKVRAWRAALAQRPSVCKAVRADYPELLRDFLLARQSALSRRMVDAVHIAQV
ncbi:glutathione S-transferase family protein [Rhodoferax sp. AJA081-3]|uniref:glutathione S-transferase family protein n=1 Tax=Rhodoferax sp. AJA081-3 TaxID=2752316 RepID=UPI001AE07028|nr:glutathione S-transferase family protein [Rhodoferax sp. AJA081-3]QTN26426.1 glutathione S-transferase family protein [Rhodoferax sp. AJA081-3]